MNIGSPKFMTKLKCCLLDIMQNFVLKSDGIDLENLIDNTIKKNMQPVDDSRGIIRNRDTSDSDYEDMSEVSDETTGEAMDNDQLEAPVQQTNLPDEKLRKKSKKAKRNKHRNNGC